MSTHDRSKLPKWAQQELGRLERDLEHERRKLTAGDEDSDTFADPYSAAPRPLGKGTRVEFRAGPGRDERVIVRVEDGRVNVYGGDSLAVFPHSSNVIEVKVQRWH